MEKSIVITIKNLMKRFSVGGDYFTALKDVNLTLKTGEFTGLIGPSGSGKTTLLNIIGGLDAPSEGQVSVLSHALDNTSHKERAHLRRKHMGFIFQSYNLLPVYTVFENVELPLILNKVDPQERQKKVAEAVAWVGLTNKINSRPSMLSGGECQRTAIARAIVHKPALILADEPTANLDSGTSTSLVEMMREINDRERTTFVFSSHDHRVIERARRLVKLEDGQVLSDERR